MTMFFISRPLELEVPCRWLRVALWRSRPPDIRVRRQFMLPHGISYRACVYLQVEQLPPEQPEQPEPPALPEGAETVPPGILNWEAESNLCVAPEAHAGHAGAASPKTSSSNSLPQASHLYS
jgi:hypothetical protein